MRHTSNIYMNSRPTYFSINSLTKTTIFIKNKIYRSQVFFFFFQNKHTKKHPKNTQKPQKRHMLFSGLAKKTTKKPPKNHCETSTEASSPRVGGATMVPAGPNSPRPNWGVVRPVFFGPLQVLVPGYIFVFEL